MACNVLAALMAIVTLLTNLRRGGRRGGDGDGGGVGVGGCGVGVDFVSCMSQRPSVVYYSVND